MNRILIAEDDADLALGLKNNLEIEGYDVRVASHGQAALDCLRQWHPALILLDIVMPRVDGLRVLHELRKNDRGTGVIVLTARDAEADKVRALKLGADDYLTKPFGLLELLARIEALLRRIDGPSGTLSFGDVIVEPRARRVRKAEAEIELRPKEFDLLLDLLRHRGQVRTRLELLRAVWGYSSAVVTRTVDTHLFELRRKLEDDATQPRHIVTVHGVGYRLQN